MQRGIVKPAQTQTTLEQPSINRVLQPAREMLTSDECLHRTRNKALLMYVDQRFKMHRRRERRKRIECFGVGWSGKVTGFRIGADELCGCSRVNKVR